MKIYELARNSRISKPLHSCIRPQRVARETSDLTETSNNGPFTISSYDITSESSPKIEPNYSGEIRYSSETNFNNSEPYLPLNKHRSTKYQDDIERGLINCVLEEDGKTTTYRLCDHWCDETINNTLILHSQSFDSSELSELKYSELTRKKSREGWVFDTRPSQILYGTILRPLAPQRLRSFFMADQHWHATNRLNGRNVRFMPSVIVRRKETDDSI
ncbi:hypothetical protein CHS0354_005829 [Potamilus streckersoni]|uniref:Uncharacterized protein n=1 Tax=Potamilus streckersoni TaxID=2493646 RepID=A0AAE0RQF4_9BIVA|nr:hypothetical protein CHS0354_005829 [Potamilus streckersoni]